MRSDGGNVQEESENSQTWIIKPMRVFGYFLEKKGVCHGGSFMFIRAILANDLHTYADRIKLLRTLAPTMLKDLFDDLKSDKMLNQQPRRYDLVELKKMSDHDQLVITNLTSGNKEIIQFNPPLTLTKVEELKELIKSVPAFFEGIKLAQEPMSIADLFKNVGASRIVIAGNMPPTYDSNKMTVLINGNTITLEPKAIILVQHDEKVKAYWIQDGEMRCSEDKDDLSIEKIQRLFNAYDLHLLDHLPNDKEIKQYNNSYIWANDQLIFVNSDGISKHLRVNNNREFQDHIDRNKRAYVEKNNQMMNGPDEFQKKMDKITKLRLKNEEVNKMMEMLNTNDKQNINHLANQNVSLKAREGESFCDIDMMNDIVSVYKVSIESTAPAFSNDRFYELAKQYQLPDKVQDMKEIRGGTRQYYPQDTINSDELIEYIDSFKKLILKSEANYPIAMQITAFEHTIGMAFDLESRNIILFNINEKSINYFSLMFASDGIAKYVRNAFDQVNISPVILTSNLYVDEINAYNSAVIEWQINQINRNFQLIEDHPERVNQGDGGTSLLYMEARLGNLEEVKHLIENNAAIEDKSKDGTALCAAVKNRHYDVVKYLIQNNANIDAVDHNGYTPLFFVAAYGAIEGNMELMKLLIENKANVNAQSPSGATPLCSAAYFGHLNSVKYLVEQGAKVDILLVNGVTPLYYAALNGQTEIVKYLVEKGANFNLALNITVKLKDEKTEKFLTDFYHREFQEKISPQQPPKIPTRTSSLLASKLPTVSDSQDTMFGKSAQHDDVTFNPLISSSQNNKRR